MASLFANTVGKPMKKLIYNSIIMILIVYIIIQLFPIRKSLEIFGFKQLIVISESMTGVLDKGDFFVIEDVDPQDLQKEDIISFFIEDDEEHRVLVTHFVADKFWHKNQLYFRTKPNVSLRWDNWVIPEADIVGKYWFRIPKIGNVILQIRYPIFLGTAVSILSMLGAVYLIIVDHHERKHEPIATEVVDETKQPQERERHEEII